MIGRKRNYPEYIRYVAGIDEAGRGPLAGPVAVGVALVAIGDLELVCETLSEIRDSKKLSAQKREDWALVARKLERAGRVRSRVSLVGHTHIEERGIISAVKTGMARSLARLDIEPGATYLLLDGGLRAAGAYTSQETIIGGDNKEPLIALAAILAKVRRDAYMTRMAYKHPHYTFDEHKGYGTKEHLKQIRKHGLSPIHRRNFVHV